jgi:2-polyprenyl-3-methyl-5-hydroxy-6-metoxy-1,4-benzoquinol methylase
MLAVAKVVTIDVRADNITEVQKRHPSAEFHVGDAEEIPELGRFDLVLCFGLLYHLENPFRAIRKLHAAAEKVLMIESMCIPAKAPRMQLLGEWNIE